MKITENVHTGEVSPTIAAASFASSRAVSPLVLSALGLITAVAALLRFHLLGSKIFWFDECVGVEIARLDWFNFARILWRREANMSLYYLFLRAWLQLGDSPAFIRSLSVILALATIPALYLLGRRLFDSRAGIIAAILLAFNAYHIRYSQEARSYALTVLLCVLSSLFFIESLQNPSRRAARVGHILTSSLAVCAHFFAALVILAQYVSLRFLDDAKIPAATRKNWRWIGLAVLPVAMFVIATGAGPLSWIPRPSLRDLWVFAIFLTGNQGPMLVMASAIACLAAVLPVFLNKRRQSSWENWRYWFLVLWLVFPVLLTVALSFARPLFLARYFVICLPALNLLMAAGLARLRSLWLVTPALIVFLMLSWQGTVSYYERDFDLGRDNWADASQFLLSNASPGDAVIFDIAMGRMPYEYNRSILSPGSLGPTVLYPNHGPRITFMDFVGKPDYAQLKNSINQYPRVWLVLSYVESPSGLEPNARTMVALLNSAYPEYQEYHFTGVDVCLFAKPDSR